MDKQVAKDATHMLRRAIRLLEKLTEDNLRSGQDKERLVSEILANIHAAEARIR